MKNILIVSSANNKLFAEGLKVFLSDAGIYHSVTTTIIKTTDSEIKLPLRLKASSIVLVLLDENSDIILSKIDIALPQAVPFLVLPQNDSKGLSVIRKRKLIRKKINFLPCDIPLRKLPDYINNINGDNHEFLSLTNLHRQMEKAI